MHRRMATRDPSSPGAAGKIGRRQVNLQRAVTLLSLSRNLTGADRKRKRGFYNLSLGCDFSTPSTTCANFCNAPSCIMWWIDRSGPGMISRMTQIAPPAPLALLALPSDAAAVSAAARRLGLTIDAVCMPGVFANLDLLGRHAAKLLAVEPRATR